jgi:hypothetical protein
MTQSWKTYEEVAQFLLNQIAGHFGLGHVEGKQVVPGDSGTNWEIDAKGVLAGHEGFLIIECRRYTKRGIPQDQVAGLAYRIRDTGADGGVIVSPLELQRGAAMVAAHTRIRSVRLAPHSTTTKYVLQFLNQTFIGIEPEVLRIGDLPPVVRIDPE